MNLTPEYILPNLGTALIKIKIIAFGNDTHWPSCSSPSWTFGSNFTNLAQAINFKNLGHFVNWQHFAKNLKTVQLFGVYSLRRVGEIEHCLLVEQVSKL